MGKILTCQTALIALLNANAFFQDRTDPDKPIVKVPVLSKQQGSVLSNLIESSIKTQGGGLVVLLRRARLLEAGTPDLALNCQFALTAVSNPTLQIQTAVPSAYDIVEAAAGILQWQFNGATPGDESETARLTLDQNAIAPLPDPKRPFLDIQVLLINTVIDISPSPA